MENQKYSKDNPFIATIKHREDLCASCPEKDTHHIVIDIQGSELTYNVGDCLGVYPVNDPTIVEKTLASIKAKGDEPIIDKKSQISYSLREFLRLKGNITDVSRKFFNEILLRQGHLEKKQQLENLLSAENTEAFKQYTYGKHLWDILSFHQEAEFTPQEVCDMLMPLLPRYYSIASSQAVFKDEIHLTVKLLRYEANGHERKGVCTNYLCHLTPKEKPIVPIFIHPHKGFTVPEDLDAPMIMVGPGTGVAPFRAFMQERIAKGATGKHWLFFGEWKKEHNFLYKDYWLNLQKEDKLVLDTAFSRDQDEKLYVQDLLIKKGKQVYEWITNGAYFYVCGDAKQMAKDVESALYQIFQTEGNLSFQEARELLKKLRKEKRYLRDVY